jgi:hypothetical protein
LWAWPWLIGCRAIANAQHQEPTTIFSCEPSLSIPSYVTVVLHPCMSPAHGEPDGDVCWPLAVACRTCEEPSSRCLPRSQILACERAKTTQEHRPFSRLYPRGRARPPNFQPRQGDDESRDEAASVESPEPPVSRRFVAQHRSAVYSERPKRRRWLRRGEFSACGAPLRELLRRTKHGASNHGLDPDSFARRSTTCWP